MKLYTVLLLKDGIRSYDCLLCPKSFLESGDIEEHIAKHKTELHLSAVCPDTKNHEEHFAYVKGALFEE